MMANDTLEKLLSSNTVAGKEMSTDFYADYYIYS